jgi:hypothetical protein
MLSLTCGGLVEKIFKIVVSFVLSIQMSLAFGGDLTASDKNEIIIGVPIHAMKMEASPIFEEYVQLFRTLNDRLGYKTKFVRLPSERNIRELKSGLVDLEIGRLDKYNDKFPKVIKATSVFSKLNLILLKEKSFNGPNDIDTVKKQGERIGYLGSTLFIKNYLKGYKNAIPLTQASDFYKVLQKKRLRYFLTMGLYYFDSLIGMDPNDRAAYTSHGGIIQSFNSYNYFSPANKKLAESYDVHLAYNSKFRREFYKASAIFQEIKLLPADHVARKVYLNLIQCDADIFN